MNRWQLIRRSLTHHWRMNLAIGLGVVAGAAVLTGALIVGDSVRGSLHDLALDRLGRIERVLVSEQFFRADLAGEILAGAEGQETFDAAVPAMFVSATLEQPDTRRRAAGVQLLGAEVSFWSLGMDAAAPPEGSGLVLNAPAAESLGVAAGDEVLVRVGLAGEVPADSPLGKKTETVRSRRMEVTDVVPGEGLGQFSLSPNQQVPLNAYVSLETLQSLMDLPGRANVVLVATADGEVADEAAAEALDTAVRPQLIDYGLRLERSERGYVQLTSEQMLLKPAVVDAAVEALTEYSPQPVLTYLANTIRIGEREIPYSTITAMDFRDASPLGPFLNAEGEAAVPLGDGEIAINQWAVDDLEAQVGDTVEVVFFEPESTHGDVAERTAEFRLATTVQLDGAAADRELTPKVEGVTDQLSLRDWDPPFPFDGSRVRDEDDEYWDEHGATPKAFVGLDAGRALWGSRFGGTTAVRFAADERVELESLAARLREAIDPAEAGFAFDAVRARAIVASTGTTPFDALFLGFSMFTIASAAMLVALVFRLGVELRAEEFGLLGATGWSNPQIRRLLLIEGVSIAAIAAGLGCGLGVAYAELMIAGLRTWWVDAISTPFLEIHVTVRALSIGYAASVLVAAGTIAWTCRGLRQVAIPRLLSGRATNQSSLVPSAARKTRWLVWGGGGLAVLLAGVAPWLSGEAQAGAFFGSGAMTLAALLAYASIRFRSARGSDVGAWKNAAVARLAMRNGARNPGRSTLTIGLVASACFLIVAISAFHLDPEANSQGPESGSGGFALLAESDQPVYLDLSSADDRIDMGFSTDDDAALADVEVFGVRTSGGDDASCLNLFRTQQPRVLGVTSRQIERGGFDWAAKADGHSDAEQENPWRLLERDLGTDEDGHTVVPVVIDMNTAMWSLQLWNGPGERMTIEDGRGQTLVLEVVGLLRNSILQGNLVMAESAFVRHFPDVNGYRFFLIDAGDRVDGTAEVLERALSDFGFDVQPSADRLAAFFAVQNTYLSTFQTLGGLGLLLGTFGLAVVQMRNVLERRGEIALLRATGFRRGTLAELVMIENVLLLVGGLGLGVVAAVVAVAPHLVSGTAAVPIGWLATTLATVMVVGALASVFAVRALLRAPLLPALRGD